MLIVTGHCLVCSFEQVDEEDYVLHLLVLSCVFGLSQLKRECEHQLDQGSLTTENLVDIFQLALLYDARRLGLICRCMILSNFVAVSGTEGWKLSQ